MRPFRPIPLLAALLSGIAGAAPGPSPDEDRTALASLETAYLACDRESRRRVLAPGEAAHCSRIGEELLQRRFGGDFDRLLAWWRAQRDDALAASDAS